jgi:hypothetical protein
MNSSNRFTKRNTERWEKRKKKVDIKKIITNETYSYKNRFYDYVDFFLLPFRNDREKDKFKTMY